jgi:hypothetical protein
MGSKSVSIQVDQNEAPGAKNDYVAVQLLKNDFTPVYIPVSAKVEKRKFNFFAALCFIGLCIYLGMIISKYNLHPISSTSDNVASTQSQDLNLPDTKPLIYVEDLDSSSDSSSDGGTIFLEIDIENQNEPEILEIEVFGDQDNEIYMDIVTENGPETIEIEIYKIENSLDIEIEIIENQLDIGNVEDNDVVVNNNEQNRYFPC